MSFSFSKTDSGEVEAHNKTVFKQLKKGDLVEFHRGAYSHWGVYIGNGRIVHLAGEGNDGIDGKVQAQHIFTISGKTFNKAKVCLDEFWNVVLDTKAYINNEKDKKWNPLTAEQIVENALSKLGRVGYSLITQNCEHFAKWCRYGVEKSDQVDNFFTGVAITMASAAAVGVIGAIAKFWGSTAEQEEEEEED